jgi:hypothetical protein
VNINRRCDGKGEEQCGEVDDGTEGQKVFFTWALNAKGFKFPKGVGFPIGKKEDVNFLVMQVHYAKKLEKDYVDSSKLHITMTNEK